MPGTTVGPSGDVVGLIQRNTDEERCLLENPTEMLTKAILLIWLCPDVVVYSTSGLQTVYIPLVTAIPTGGLVVTHYGVGCPYVILMGENKKWRQS